MVTSLGNKKPLNLVLEGGGVKGIGLVGAIEEFEMQGYSWSCIGGTSAGAIVATLLAVGYTGQELRKVMADPKMNFINMMDDLSVRQDFLKVKEQITEAIRTKRISENNIRNFSNFEVTEKAYHKPWPL